MRKAKEIDPGAARLTDDVPGRAGQGPDHHRVPQRDLLRPRRLRDRGGGRRLLRRHRPRRADAGPGRPAGRAPEVAVDARPVPLRGQGRRGPPGRAARRAGRSSAATGSSTGLADGAAGRSSTPAELAAALRRAGRPGRRAGRSRYQAAHFTWQVRRQLEAILGDAETSRRGGYRVITTLDWKAQRLAEKWLGRGGHRPRTSPARRATRS